MLITKLKLLYYSLRVAWFLYLASRKKDKLTLHLAVAQLRVVGYKNSAAYDETKNNEQWYSTNAWPNRELQTIFAKKATKTIQRKYKLTPKHAAREWAWFDLCYGLRSPQSKNDSDPAPSA